MRKRKAVVQPCTTATPQVGQHDKQKFLRWCWRRPCHALGSDHPL